MDSRYKFPMLCSSLISRPLSSLSFSCPAETRPGHRKTRVSFIIKVLGGHELTFPSFLLPAQDLVLKEAESLSNLLVPAGLSLSRRQHKGKKATPPRERESVELETGYILSLRYTVSFSNSKDDLTFMKCWFLIFGRP